MTKELNKVKNLFRSIKDIDFSVRTSNVLNTLGINYLHEVVILTESSLLAKKNFGRRSLAEIKHYLQENDLCIGMNKEYVRTLISEIENINELDLIESEDIESEDIEYDDDPPKLESKDVFNDDDLPNGIEKPFLGANPLEIDELSIRAKNIISDLKLNTVKELIKFGKGKLRHQRNCGRKTIKEFEDVLHKHGLSFNTRIFEINKKLNPKFDSFNDIDMELTDKEKLLIGRITNYIGLSGPISIHDLVGFEVEKFLLPVFDGFKLKEYIELINKLDIYIETNINDIHEGREKVVELRKIKSSCVGDRVLCSLINNFTNNLDERELNIFLERNGMGSNPKSTLENLGRIYFITRERIRQVDAKIKKKLKMKYIRKFKGYLREIIKKNIEQNDDLCVSFSKVYSLFINKKVFLSFLESFLDFRSDYISDHQGGKSFLEIHKDEILKTLVTSCKFPLSEGFFNELIKEDYGFNMVQINSLKETLIKNKKIRVDKEKVYAINLPQPLAYANFLLDQPNGLPWKDVAKGVNKLGLTKTKITEDRATHSFNNNTYIFLCGRGCYKHRNFIDIDDETKFEIIDYVEKSLIASGRSKMRLEEMYGNSELKSKCSYFQFRDTLRSSNSINFIGRSGVDTVCIDGKNSWINTREYIFQIIKKSPEALTVNEITKKTRSKSRAFVRLLLNKLMDEFWVLRVNKILYNTFEKIEKEIEVAPIYKEILELLESNNKIIESEYLKEYLDVKLGLNYPKYLYLSLAKMVCREKNLYAYHHLVSSKPIRHKGVKNAFLRHYKEGDSFLALSVKLKKEFEIAESTLRWVWASKRIFLGSQDESDDKAA